MKKAIGTVENIIAELEDRASYEVKEYKKSFIVEAKRAIKILEENIKITEENIDNLNFVYHEDSITEEVNVIDIDRITLNTTKVNRIARKFYSQKIVLKSVGEEIDIDETIKTNDSNTFSKLTIIEMANSLLKVNDNDCYKTITFITENMEYIGKENQKLLVIYIAMNKVSNEINN